MYVRHRSLQNVTDFCVMYIILHDVVKGTFSCSRCYQDTYSYQGQ